MLNRKTTFGKDLQARAALTRKLQTYKENSASVFILNYLFYSYIVTNCPHQK